MSFFIGRTLHIFFIIRIFNGCELRIENSVTTVAVQNREACRLLHTLPSTIAFRLEYVFVYQFYTEQK